jgi:superfamily II DNA or RNA helicase
MDSEDFDFMLQDLVYEQAERGFGKARNEVKNVLKRTIGRIEAKLDIRTGVAEETTEARAKALEDIRNMISFAAAYHYIVSKVHPTLIINADATQLNVFSNIMNKPKVKYLYRKRTISG